MTYLSVCSYTSTCIRNFQIIVFPHDEWINWISGFQANRIPLMLKNFMMFSPSWPAAIAVSRDHKPDQTDERQRIEDAGGFVMWAGSDSFESIYKKKPSILIYAITVISTVWLFEICRDMASGWCSRCLSSIWW
jgi:hypothetical protein